jgi:3-deoxy-D-manno-octulosonate 8-phosphate phosphatase KdsC-like HAD superfamily phosphatase
MISPRSRHSPTTSRSPDPVSIREPPSRESRRVRGIDAADVVAIGDAPNDLALFDFAGISIAMANAPESVRARASMVTYSNDDDGVAAVLEILIRT